MKVTVQDKITNVRVQQVKEYEVTVTTNILQQDAITKGTLQAKGDLVGASGAATPVRIPAADADGKVLKSNSAAAAGVEWGIEGAPDLIEAKGDLLAGSGADALGRLPAGADGQVLKADSGQALGVGWTDHDKAAHDALGIDADTVDGHEGHAPTKAAHDALGIDADTVDGKHASDLVLATDYEDADVLAKVKNVDGAGSGLDADLVDGQHASAFASAGHTHALGDLSNVTATGEGSGGGFDADTVDGKHWSSMKYGGGTLIVGNKDGVLASGEEALLEVPYACTLRELKAREVDELSGSATLTLEYYSSISDGSADWTEDISLSSQWYRSRTGLSRSLAKGGWLRLVVSGTPSTVKRVAVSVVVERT